jgi:hypothetical protein
MRFIVMILMVCFVSAAYCQIINGKVLDKETQKPVIGATILLLNYYPTEDTMDIEYVPVKRLVKGISFQLDSCDIENTVELENVQIEQFKIIQHTLTDSLGNYVIKINKPGTFFLLAKYEIPHLIPNTFFWRQDIDTSLLLTKNTNYNKTFHLMITCPFEKTRGQLFCPICKQTDRVVPYLYGLPIFDENGRVGGLEMGQYISVGCILPDGNCNPAKHCKRCNTDFDIYDPYAPSLK